MSKIAMPKDASGVPINRAMGAPIAIHGKKLGSGTKFVDLLELDSFGERVFVGISVINPSAAVSVHLCLGAPFADDIHIVVPPSQNMAFDNLTFGPAVLDEVTGEKCLRVRAKLSANSGTAASGKIAYGAIIPADGNTVEIGSKVYEFVTDSSAAVGNIPVPVKATADLTWDELVKAINANEQAVSASLDAGANEVNIVSNYGGTSGNDFPVKDGASATGATFPAGDKLAGGADGVEPVIHIW